MQLGLLTARFKKDDWPIERIIDFAAEAGFDCLEVAAPRDLSAADVADPARRKALLARLKSAGVAISALACYDAKITDPAHRGEAVATLVATIEAAEQLGVGVVCALAGFPAPGKSKSQTIREDLPAIFAPALERAERCGVRIAIENWFATCLQHLDHWAELFAAVPHPRLGLNFDPSHLFMQRIDPLAAAREFAPRIFHTHAKDVTIDDAKLARVGILERGWWRFCVPGAGRIDWGECLGALRQVGFDGAVSIEHEDGTLGAEDGFRLAGRFLRGLMA